mgnify:CR=1 FL=1
MAPFPSTADRDIGYQAPLADAGIVPIGKMLLMVAQGSRAVEKGEPCDEGNSDPYEHDGESASICPGTDLRHSQFHMAWRERTDQVHRSETLVAGSASTGQEP